MAEGIDPTDPTTEKTLSSQTQGMMMMMMMLISPNTIYMVIQSTQSQTEHNPLNQAVLPPQPVVSQYL